MKSRTLVLKRELVTELTADELRAVAGAAPSGNTCPVRDCLTAISGEHTCVDCLTRSC